MKLEVIRNTDSFRFAFHSLTSVEGDRWWLINLYFATLLINHPS
jgi:hypothetical protein